MSTPCYGKSELFDSTDLHDHHEAAALCKTCPAILACRMSTPPRTEFPVGTWAGLLYTISAKYPVAERVARCVVCEQEFTPSRQCGPAKYCGDECRATGRHRGDKAWEMSKLREIGREAS